MKKSSAYGVGDALGATHLAPIASRKRATRVPALAKPARAKGKRPTVSANSLGVGDAMAVIPKPGKSGPKPPKGMLPPPGPKMVIAVGMGKKPGEGKRLPEKHGEISAKEKAKPASVTVIGLHFLKPKPTEAEPAGGREPYRPEEMETGSRASGGKKPKIQGGKHALGARAHLPQLIVLATHRGGGGHGAPRPGGGVSGPEFRAKKPPAGGKR